MKKQKAASSADPIDVLALYRLDRGITFGELSNEMRGYGYAIPERTLIHVLAHRSVPRATTIHKIHRFLEQLTNRKVVDRQSRRIADAVTR